MSEPSARAVFPDMQKLVDRHPAGEHRVAQVPGTDTFVLYAIHEDRHEVEIIEIRTWDPTVG